MLDGVWNSGGEWAECKQIDGCVSLLSLIFIRSLPEVEKVSVQTQTDEGMAAEGMAAEVVLQFSRKAT